VLAAQLLDLALERAEPDPGPGSAGRLG
jgi:hypothetical protein